MREYGTPDPSDGFHTLDHERRTMESHKIAFPDKHTELHHLVAEGDLVACSCTVRATQTGPNMGLAPTGKRVEPYEMMINRIRDGRISESWAISTGKGFFEQRTGEKAPDRLDNMGWSLRERGGRRRSPLALTTAFPGSRARSGCSGGSGGVPVDAWLVLR